MGAGKKEDHAANTPCYSSFVDFAHHVSCLLFLLWGGGFGLGGLPLGLHYWLQEFWFDEQHVLVVFFGDGLPNAYLSSTPNSQCEFNPSPPVCEL